MIRKPSFVYVVYVVPLQGVSCLEILDSDVGASILVTPLKVLVRSPLISFRPASRAELFVFWPKDVQGFMVTDLLFCTRFQDVLSVLLMATTDPHPSHVCGLRPTRCLFDQTKCGVFLFSAARHAPCWVKHRPESAATDESSNALLDGPKTGKVSFLDEHTQ